MLMLVLTRLMMLNMIRTANKAYAAAEIVLKTLLYCIVISFSVFRRKLSLAPVSDCNSSSIPA